MKDNIEYNGFLGSLHFDSDDEIFFGKIETVDVSYKHPDYVALNPLR